jgi:hypothetical protein
MGIGIRLRKLWGLKAGVAVSFMLALFVSVWSVQKISLSPPGLTPRSLEMATASTHVVVDTPTSALIDLRQDTYSLESLRNRAILLGNVIASTTVRQNIARKARVAVEQLRIQPPLTKQQSAPPADSDNARRTSDILASTDQFRLNIQANATVPVLDIYAQAPDAERAGLMANAAVDELRGYLAALAVTEQTPAKDQIHLIQLGRARGTIINKGVDWQVAMLAFLLTFGASCASVIYLSRVRAGWRLAALQERSASA